MRRDHVLDGLTIGVVLVAAVMAGSKVLGSNRQEGPGASPSRGTTVGAQVPDIHGERLDGTAIVLGFVGREPTLLLVFRADCQACQRTRPVWEALASRIPLAVKVLALSPAGFAPAVNFFESARIDVSYVLPSALAAALPLDAVPATFIVSPEGKVAYGRIGVLLEQDRTEIERLVRSLRLTD